MKTDTARTMRDGIARATAVLAWGCNRSSQDEEAICRGGYPRRVRQRWAVDHRVRPTTATPAIRSWAAVTAVATTATRNASVLSLAPNHNEAGSNAAAAADVKIADGHLDRNAQATVAPTTDPTSSVAVSITTAVGATTISARDAAT